MVQPATHGPRDQFVGELSWRCLAIALWTVWGQIVN